MDKTIKYYKYIFTLISLIEDDFSDPSGVYIYYYSNLAKLIGNDNLFFLSLYLDSVLKDSYLLIFNG